MKNLISILVIAVSLLTVASCTKEAPNQGGGNPFYVPGGGTTDPGGDPDPAPSNPVGEVPASFTKKVLIEKLTGEWCGACPNGGTAIESIIIANPGRVYSASFQMGNGDPFQIPEASIWRSHLVAGSGTSGGSFPSASISRRPSITLPDYKDAALDKRGLNSINWINQTNDELALNADCGLAIVSSEENDKVSVDVYVGYNNPITIANTHVTVYLIENDVPESSPGAQAGAADGYLHQHMVRDVLTAELGNPVDLNVASATNYAKIEIKDFDIAGKYNDKSNLKILAFVNIKGASGKELGVLNVQEVTLGETVKFD